MNPVGLPGMAFIGTGAAGAYLPSAVAALALYAAGGFLAAAVAGLSFVTARIAVPDIGAFFGEPKNRCNDPPVHFARWSSSGKTA